MHSMMLLEEPSAQHIPDPKEGVHEDLQRHLQRTSCVIPTDLCEDHLPDRAHVLLLVSTCSEVLLHILGQAQGSELALHGRLCPL